MRHLCFLLLLILAGCANRPYLGSDALGAQEFVMDSYQVQLGKVSQLNYEGGLFEPLSPKLLEEVPDLIDDGDIIAIRLFHPTKHDDLAKIGSFFDSGFQVQNGLLALPLIGVVKVENLTLNQAQAKVEHRFREQIESVEVFLSYKERLEKRVEIAGQTQLTSLPVNGKMRLFDVLSKAKVPTNANLFKSYLVRNDKLLPVDFVKLVQNGDMTQNVVMRASDKVYIAGAESSNFYVMGEVKQQGAFPIITGTVPLREALAKAGGILVTGDRAYIQVIRGNLIKPKIYTLTWNHIIHLPSNSLLLIPGDIVYVAATPITQWNRFVNQLFPSFTAYEFFRKGISGVIIQ